MARYSIFVHHISNRARVHCKRHIKHQPMRCLWLQNHMKIQRMKAPSKPSAKRLRTAKYSRHKADNANQKMLILQLLFQFTHYHNRPHVYTTPLLSAQSTRHVLATNSDNHASPRIRTQGTNLPELHHYPNLAVRTQEFQSQSPWGWTQQNRRHLICTTNSQP